MTGPCRKLENHMLDGSHAHVGQTRHCLLQLLDISGGGIEQLLLHGLLDSLVYEAGSSTANLAASNQNVWIFFWQRPNSSQSGLRHLDFVPDGLERHFGPPKPNGHPFFLPCSSLQTWLLSTGKCDLGSCIIFIVKMVFHCLEL
jgi:hypothetical protein